MKALTNILTRLLMLLLLMLVACTEDAAEVDNLVRGEEYVQVRMQVPGMKNATTRADEAEDNLTSVVVLVFRNDALVSKTEVTTASSTLTTTTATTGYFNIPRPKSGDVIHFLGNVPSDVTLPDVGDDESALCNLTTAIFYNLSYWGKATYTSGESINVTLYRNMAKIEIVAGDECTFPEDSLFIAGLVKPIEKGTLVPYKDGFNFNLNDNDYYTLPSSLSTPASRSNNQLPEPTKSLYIFEHDNPGTANGLYIICEIDEDYYKVALIDEKEEPYPIIRNHRYVIYVNDLDEGADSFDIAASPETKPYNFEVREYRDAPLVIDEQDISLQYSNTAQEEVTLSVTVPADVASLSVSADGFTVTSGDSKMTYDNGVYRINNTSTEQTVRFKLRLNNDADATHSVTISGVGVNEFVTVVDATTTITTTPYSTNVANEQTLWLGSVSLDNNDNQTQIPVSYSLFFDGNETQVMPEGSKLFIVYESSKGWIQAATPGNWESLPGLDADNSIIVTITDEVLTQIREQHNGDVAFYVQGNEGKTLKKIYWVSANGAITATKANENPLYHNADNQSITVTATVPAGVSTLYLSARDFNVTQNGNTLTETNDGDDNPDNNIFTFNIEGDTSNERNIDFVFTLKDEVQSAKESIIKFSADYMNSAKVTVTVAENVEFAQSSNQIYINGNNKSNLNVTMTVPQNSTITALRISAPGFTIKQGETPLGDGNYTGSELNIAANSSVVYTFVPNTFGKGKQITFTASGTNLQETTRTLNVDVLASIFASATVDNPTLYYDQDNQTVTVYVTMPIGLSAINIGGAGNFTITTNAAGTFENNVYTRASATTEETIPFVFTLDKSKYTSQQGDTSATFTFSDASTANQNDKATQGQVYVNLKSTPSVTTSMTITPSTAVLDLSKSTSVTLTLKKPENVKDIRISGLDKFDIALSSNATNSWFNGGYYYYQGLTAQQIELTLTIKSQYFATAGNDTITFYEGINAETQSESISATIQVKTNYADGVIWEGNKELVNSGYILNYTSFKDYRNSNKKLKIDITTTGDGWKQLFIRYKDVYGQDLISSTGLNLDSTLSIDIPTEDKNIVISGEGGVSITKIYVE